LPRHSPQIIKIVSTSCEILRRKCTKFDFGWGSAPNHAGRAYSDTPDPLAGIQGSTSKGRERKGRRKGRGGEGAALSPNKNPAYPTAVWPM